MNPIDLDEFNTFFVFSEAVRLFFKFLIINEQPRPFNGYLDSGIIERGLSWFISAELIGISLEPAGAAEFFKLISIYSLKSGI